MPQYKNTQYGLKQYGAFLPISPGGKNRNWQFIKSRCGYRRKGKTFWLYTHTPVSFHGKTTKIRIKANDKKWIQEETIQLKGTMRHIRLSSNRYDETIYSQQLKE